MIIEVVIEVISITLYSVVFYRYHTKRKLMKSMDMRDKARSDLYLAQLRSQSAPNTPGFGPKSPGFASYYGPKSPGMYSQHTMSPRLPPSAAFRSLGDIEEGNPFTPAESTSPSRQARSPRRPRSPSSSRHLLSRHPAPPPRPVPRSHSRRSKAPAPRHGQARRHRHRTYPQSASTSMAMGLRRRMSPCMRACRFPVRMPVRPSRARHRFRPRST